MQRQDGATRDGAFGKLIVAALLLLGSGAYGVSAFSPDDAAAYDREPASSGAVHRSPVDLLLTPDETRLITANQTADSISLVDVAQGTVLDEVACGDRPSSLAMTPDGKKLLATATFSGELFAYALVDDKLQLVGSLWLGFEPRGLAISPDGKLAYVALTTAAEVAIVDIEQLQLIERIAVGHWPRYLALSPDGARLAVGCSGDGGVAVIDTASRKQRFIEDFGGLNLGEMQVSADGKYVYFPWIVYRQNPITVDNIRRGWVLASRIARVRLDEHARREAISLDPEGKAVGDPHGIALSPDEQTIVCTASGTHELLVYKLPGLPFQDYGGPGDHINPELLRDSERFYRIPLGGRPMAVRYSKQGELAYVANYLLDAVQVVDVSGRQVAKTIALGESPAPTLARQGEAIFYDAVRSLDQWYSCHSCHYEGHTNRIVMDTRNDGRFGNFKTILSLRGAQDTGPWFWHGWETELRAALHKSLIDTMLGEKPTEHEVDAVTAFVATLEPPRNPRRQSGELSEAALRGEEVFHGEKAGCANCHPAPQFTDGRTHDVGLGAANDAYPEYSAPSLRGVYDRVLLLHDGRAKNLHDVLHGPHNPANVTGLGELTPDEVNDLVSYLESL
ncbi:MAG: beta-propeller fold lactonase family protein [Pirellulales bacterium]|nr:beta-propeller fold lactonase family protein [Pirellulales bacterium]